MSEELLNLSQLSKEAQHEAVSNFASFYFNLYEQNGLEIMTAYDQNGVMNDINDDFLRHQNENNVDTINASANDSFDRYCDLLNQIGQKFYANGNSEIPWSKWYDNKFSKIGRG